MHRVSLGTSQLRVLGALAICAACSSLDALARGSLAWEHGPFAHLSVVALPVVGGFVVARNVFFGSPSPSSKVFIVPFFTIAECRALDGVPRVA